MARILLPEDAAVAERVRALRLMSGLTQQQMAELIGVTYQQAHKYEAGINRISAGRLHIMARALRRPIADFFPDAAPAAIVPEHHRRAMAELGLLLDGMEDRSVAALLLIARALAGAGREARWRGGRAMTLREQQQEIVADLPALWRQFEEAKIAIDEADFDREDDDPIIQRFLAAREAIWSARPTDLPGLVVQLRMFRLLVESDEPNEDQLATLEHVAEQLEAMAGEEVAPPTRG